MTIQDVRLFSLAPACAGFADPDWRGERDDEDARLRPTSELMMWATQLEAWIRAGDDYGWLGSYQARRAAFELQSIRAQISEARTSNGGSLGDRDRRAIQARMNRLAACLEAARGILGAG